MAANGQKCTYERVEALGIAGFLYGGKNVLNVL
jgi:hypothetical protein